MCHKPRLTASSRGKWAILLSGSPRIGVAITGFVSMLPGRSTPLTGLPSIRWKSLAVGEPPVQRPIVDGSIDDPGVIQDLPALGLLVSGGHAGNQRRSKDSDQRHDDRHLQ